MRNVVILSFITLDGVMQAPGGPTEDTSGDFKYGGWTVPYFDEALGKLMDKQMGQPFDLLLGRKTYDIFKSYWPQHAEEGASINAATKYVASTTVTDPDWEKTIILQNDVVEEVKKIKEQDGPDLQVHGSANFIQTLLAHDLVDKLWLKIFPITLGAGKRLFAEGTIPAAFTLEYSETTPKGVVVANFDRAGKVETGSF